MKEVVGMIGGNETVSETETVNVKEIENEIEIEDVVVEDNFQTQPLSIHPI